MLGPLECLIVGMGLILFLILYLRLHAFLALIISALAVAFLSERVPVDDAVYLVTNRFGEMMGSIGLLLALAAIIGKCLMDSGAADRIIRGFSRLFGAGRENHSLLASGYVLSIPVFFDTVFYLLAPLARAVYARRKRDYVLIICATAAGAAMTHALVPPTPGPILVAEELRVSIGLTMLIGVLAALVPVIMGGICFANWINKRMDIIPRDVLGISQKELEATAAKPDEELPSISMAILPFLLPVILLAGSSIILQQTGTGFLEKKDFIQTTFFTKIQQQERPIDAYLWNQLNPETQEQLNSLDPDSIPPDEITFLVVEDINQVITTPTFYEEERFAGIELSQETQNRLTRYRAPNGVLHCNRLLLEDAYPETLRKAPWGVITWTKLLGDKNVAFIFGAFIAVWLLITQKKFSLKETSDSLAPAIASGAVIAFITCGGAAFGKALDIAGIGDMIADAARDWGLSMLLLAYLTSTLIRVAQGSATVAMVTTAGILAATLDSLGAPLSYHPVYLVCMIGLGATGFSWMNDSGFWIFGQLTGLTESQTLKTWTALLTIMSVSGFIWVYVLATILPLQ